MKWAMMFFDDILLFSDTRRRPNSSMYDPAELEQGKVLPEGGVLNLLTLNLCSDIFHETLPQSH